MRPWSLARSSLLACAAALLAGIAVPASAQSLVGRPFEDVVRYLASPDPKLRVEAMRTLAQTAHADAIGPIATLAADPVEAIQLEALETLLRFYIVDVPSGTKRVAGVFETGRKDPGEAAFAIGPYQLLPRAVPDSLKNGLAKAMRDDQARVRREATWTLGALVPPPAGAAAEASLAANLRDPDDSVRVAAARVAGAVRAGSLGDALVAAMNDPRAEVQLAAMRALGDIGEKRASRALRERFVHDQRGPGAEAALDGLARLADSTSQPVFFEQVASKDADLRRAAFEGLARLGDVAAIRAVEGRSGGERDRTVRLARAFALARDAGRGLPELTAALGDDRRAEQAMAYLVELGRPHVKALVPRLGDPDVPTRGRLVQVFGIVGGPEALQALEPTTRDPDPVVARAAEHAIARIRLAAR
ncbi:MAG: HEAT repeat domain-containing protein [Vicinamibacteraceae bacterium]